jgi:uncharacterized protein YndB with AHSA1/START domain
LFKKSIVARYENAFLQNNYYMTTEDNHAFITIRTTVHAPVEKVWQLWTDPEHIMNWNYATSDWHTPYASNDLRKEGNFLYRMEDKKGTTGFDFEGTYTELLPYEKIEFRMTDGRYVTVEFIPDNDVTSIIERFEPEENHPVELQKLGWQAILTNFRKYAEAVSDKEKMHFDIHIHASPEKVFNIMLDKNHYKEWASVFNQASRYEGSWKKGSEIRFLGTDREGNTGGMISRVADYVPGQFVSIEHLGIIQEGNEITSGPEVKNWAGTTENYSFAKHENGTLLTIDADVNEDFKDYFIDTWPKALNKLKTICEQQL